MALNPMKRHHERCREVRSHMSDSLDGEIAPADASAIERHTRWCFNSRRMLTNLRRTVGGLRALRDIPTPADDPRSQS